MSSKAFASWYIYIAFSGGDITSMDTMFWISSRSMITSATGQHPMRIKCVFSENQTEAQRPCRVSHVFLGSIFLSVV